MGVDKRYKIGVSIVGGGDISRIVWESPATRFVRRFIQSFGVTNKDYENLLTYQKNFLKEKKRTGKIPRTKCFWYLIDPITYASRRDVLFINGRFDPIIPRCAALEFRERCGNPPIMWIPADHFTLIFRRYIIRKTINFLIEESRIRK
jgi:pimeloyl-ACP methyl ester carboxylesterase